MTSQYEKRVDNFLFQRVSGTIEYRRNRNSLTTPWSVPPAMSQGSQERE